MAVAAALLVCACRSPSPAPDAGPPGLRLVPALEEPGAVTTAVALRKTNPAGARSRLESLRGWAVDAGDARTAALALDHLGDLYLDRHDALSHQVNEDDDADGGEPLTEFGACGESLERYERALTLAQLLDEPRLVGRVAHDLGWGLERCGSRWDAIGPYEVALAARRRDLDALGVRKTANNLARLVGDDPPRAQALFLEALAAATVAHDLDGQRKVNANLARQWWFHRDPSDFVPDAGRSERAALPFTGVARDRALAHAAAAVAAAREAGLPASAACEAIALVACNLADAGVETFFPEHDEE